MRFLPYPNRESFIGKEQCLKLSLTAPKHVTDQDHLGQEDFPESGSDLLVLSDAAQMY